MYIAYGNTALEAFSYSLSATPRADPIVYSGCFDNSALHLNSRFFDSRPTLNGNVTEAAWPVYRYPASASSHMRGNATGDEGTLQETGQPLHLSVLTVLLLDAQAKVSNDAHCNRSTQVCDMGGATGDVRPNK